MKLSIIIVNYNVRYFLEQCLTSVQAALQSIDGEIIVVDNVSKDTSCQMVKYFFPSITLIENKKNVGFSKANNQGVAIAKGKYVLILNPDTVVAEDTFVKILEQAEQMPNLGILGVKLIDGTGHFLPESKRGLPTPKVAFNKLFGISNPKKGKYYATHLTADKSGNIDVLVGAFMLIERDKYKEVGGFDEDYFMFGEDIDLSYKMLQKGYENYYYSKTSIIHYKGESTAKNTKYLHNFYGAMRIFYKKHFRLNVFFDMSMSLGIHFWKWLRFFQIKSIATATTQPKNLLYIGNEQDVYKALQKVYPQAEVHIFSVCTTRVISKYDDLNHIEKLLKEKAIDEIVFDNQSNTFAKIIFYMTSLKDRKLRFKIRPKNTNFCIGSNDKDGKGEVVLLSQKLQQTTSISIE